MIMIKKHNDLFKFNGNKFIFNNRYVIYITYGSNTNIVLDKIYYYKDGYYICLFHMVWNYNTNNNIVIENKLLL